LAGIFIKNFIVGMIALTALFTFQALMGAILDHEFPTNQILYYHFLGIPQVAIQMTPPAVMLATVLTLAAFARNNELIAAYSIGIGLRRIVLLLMSIVFVISCFVLISEDRFLPLMFRKRTTYYWREMKQRPDFYLDIKQDKIWYRSQNLIYNLQRFDAQSKTIYGMAIYEFDPNFNLKRVVNAEKAEFQPKGWRLMNGTVTAFAPAPKTQDDRFPATSKFEEQDLTISETPKDFQEIEKEVDGLRLIELNRYIKRIKKAGADTKSYEVKLQSRISLSFIPLVMCLLGVPFSTRGRREGGLAKDLAVCLGVTFFYWLFYSIGLSLGTNGVLPAWLAAWLPSVIFAAIAAMLLGRKTA
jgi:lipopolysaccharide export system permease protein